MGEIFLEGRRRRFRWPQKSIRHLIGLSGDVAEVHGELRDEEKLSLHSLRPGGGRVGLGHGRGQWLMVRIQEHPRPIHEVLKLPDGGEDGEELAVERAVPCLRVRESPEASGWRHPPTCWCRTPAMAMSEALVVMDSVAWWAGCTKREAEAMARLTSWTACSISPVTLNSFLEQDRESVKGRMVWARHGRKRR